MNSDYYKPKENLRDLRDKWNDNKNLRMKSYECAQELDDVLDEYK